jgi:DNA polymerase sigma
MPRSYANGRQPKKKKQKKLVHDETIAVPQALSEKVATTPTEDVPREQPPWPLRNKGNAGADHHDDAACDAGSEEVEWKDDDFLAFGTKPLSSNDPSNNHKSGSRRSRPVDDTAKSASAAAGGSYDSMEEADDMEESSTSSSSSEGEENATSTPPWLLLRNPHHHRHHHHNSSSQHRSGASNSFSSSSSSPLVDLHNEILQFVKLMEPFEKERVSRLAVIQELQAAVVSEFGPSAQLLVLGSQATNLFLPTSDIDLTLQYQDEDDDGNNNEQVIPQPSSYNPLYKKPIHRFSDLMASKEWKDRLSYLETIEATRVPIVKMRFAATDIAVDVSFNQANGVMAATLMTEYLKAMPPLRPMTIILKYFLAARDLNEPYSGGVGSYLLQLLIVSFLQQRERAAYHDNMNIDYNLGGLLLDFLELYGLDFNYLVTGLSVRFDGFYYRKGRAARPNCISVENPLDVAHDVGSSSYRFTMVQRSFAIAYKTLIAMITPGPKLPEASTSASILGSILPTSPYMTSRLVVKRHDMALSAPRLHNNVATAGAARGRQRPPPVPPSSMGSFGSATLPTTRNGSDGGGGAVSSSAPPTWNGTTGALSAPRFAAPRPSQDARKKRKTDY